VDTYVTDKDGTGIVHQAPGFGEDDHRIALAYEVINADEMPPCPIDDAGRFTSDVPDFAGQYVKVSMLRDILLYTRSLFDRPFHQDADKEIMKVLKAKGRLVRQDQERHQYPFCWRSRR
jgi:isoleucyl-tRNA synthetase